MEFHNFWNEIGFQLNISISRLEVKRVKKNIKKCGAKSTSDIIKNWIDSKKSMEIFSVGTPHTQLSKHKCQQSQRDRINDIL